jgi:hypothetical protein
LKNNVRAVQAARIVDDITQLGVEAARSVNEHRRGRAPPA